MQEKKNRNPEENKRFPDGFRILQGSQEYVTYPDHSSVRIWPDGTAWYFANHRHSAIEVMLCTLGEIVYTVDERTYTVTEGEILLIPSDHPHSMTIRENSFRYLYLFEPDVLLNLRDIQPLKEWLNTPLHLKAEDAVLEAVKELLLKAAACYEEKVAMWNTRCYACFIEMYAILGAWYTEEKGTVLNKNQTHTVNPELMNSAMTYIEQNFRKNITLEEVAAFAGFSKFYFSRNFNAFTGVNFVQYLNRRRMSMADYMLVHTREPVAEIAAASGFGSLATFNRTFRAMHGCTPSKFRSIYGEYMG